MARAPYLVVDPASPLAKLSALAQCVRQRLRPQLHRPGEIHDLRVALRRLRVGLSVLLSTPNPVLSAGRRRRLEDGARRLLHRLGPLRDWDVLRHKLAESPASAHGADAKTLEQQLARRRQQRLRKVRRTLETPRTRRLRRRLAKLQRHLEASAAHTDRAASGQAFRALARETLGLQLDTLHQRVAALDPANDEDLHRLRVQLKKLRYTAELFVPLFPPARTVKFLSSVESVQQALGQAHDTAIESTLVACLPRKTRALARARLGNAGREHLNGALDAQASLQTLSALRPFWLAAPRRPRGR